MHSLDTASEFGVNSAGNGRAWNFEHEPIVRMRNTLMISCNAFEALKNIIEIGVERKPTKLCLYSPDNGGEHKDHI